MSDANEAAWLMTWWWGPALILPFVLVGLGAATMFWADRRPRRLRSWVTAGAGLQLLATAVAVCWHGLCNFPVLRLVAWEGGERVPLGISLYLDGIASGMLLLVSFIGWVICRFSIRYLDGDARQGSYFSAVSITLGAVLLGVVAGHLAFLLAAWLLAGWGLHRLLLHDRQREAARNAAWLQFAMSRVGDAALLLASAALYQAYGTLDLAELFAAARSAAGSAQAAQPLPLVGLLLVLAAGFKSAQFPSHGWLPQTLDTPTPVSALMHAGIVNAGGYLIIRCSPLMAHAPAASMVLVVWGTLTAVLAGVVMTTQSSVKRGLAYSTVAQMGFMLLQCGLGAYSAAFLHLVAHSLYKAHAFLGSGSVLQSPGPRPEATDQERLLARLSRGGRPLARVAGGSLLAWAVGSLIAVAATLTLLGPALWAKPGITALGMVLLVAVGHLVLEAYRQGGYRLATRAAATGGLLFSAYAFCYLAADRLLASNPVMTRSPASPWAVGVVLTGLLVLVLVRWVIRGGRPATWKQAFYVHASHGFYAELLTRRVANRVATS